ncbi:MAG: protein-S-isoprenylcysteine O-methyltransferase Ste14 [Verrucomicrobiales bacterium]|jgi:protein-S-isoprenylcysteine O-methyltransferase Ste14
MSGHSNPRKKDGTNAIGSVLVAMQFIALTILVAHAIPAMRSWPSALVIVGAVVLMGWALVSMGKVTFSFHPDPSMEGELRTVGAYRWVRHPMYTSAISASLAVVWKNPVPLVLVSATVVVAVLYLKLRIEEAALTAKFPGYPEYCSRVPALIPFLSPRFFRWESSKGDE